MKQGIHPQYQTAIVHCACGNKFETRSTQKDIHLDICSVCHPYFRTAEAGRYGGRVERFRQKWEARKRRPRSNSLWANTKPVESRAEARLFGM
jgi:large subunit ribosomal protein L31